MILPSFLMHCVGHVCGADNVLMTPAIRSVAPRALIAAADIMVTIHVLGSFQVYSMPVSYLFIASVVPYRGVEARGRTLCFTQGKPGWGRSQDGGMHTCCQW